MKTAWKVLSECELSEEQSQVEERAAAFARDALASDERGVLVIVGDAGTGKSVLLCHLFKRLQQLRRAKGTSDDPLSGAGNYLLVNHNEVLKTYQQYAASEKILHKKDFMRPTSFVNQMQKRGETADIVLVDEAHLLLSRPDHYNFFYGSDHLSSILDCSKVAILVFDPKQAIRTKGFWTLDKVSSICATAGVDRYEEVRLSRQFRMHANQGLLGWVDSLTLDKAIGPLHREDIAGYDFRIFDDAQRMYEAICQRESEAGMSRIVSTVDYPSALDGKVHYLDDGDFHLPWDQYNFETVPWAEMPDSINEVGSYYTVQGFDLNYIGVIMGPSISLSSDGEHIDVDMDKVTDKETFRNRGDFDPDEYARVSEALYLNGLNVMMKRGIHGLYLFCHDAALDNRLRQVAEKAR